MCLAICDSDKKRWDPKKVTCYGWEAVFYGWFSIQNGFSDSGYGCFVIEYGYIVMGYGFLVVKYGSIDMEYGFLDGQYGRIDVKYPLMDGQYGRNRGGMGGQVGNQQMSTWVHSKIWKLKNEEGLRIGGFKI